MQNNKEKFIDYLAQIISYAVEAKIHFEVITSVLSKSNLLKNIERNDYSIINNKTSYELFIELFDKTYINDNNYMKFDASYWCGYVYGQLFYQYAKPFAFIFLKLPLEKLMYMYDIYHEMDISQLFEKFLIEIKLETIIKLLLKKHSISGTELSRRTQIPLRTIDYLKASDDNLYKASFSIIQRIALVLDEPSNLFLEKINITID